MKAWTRPEDSIRGRRKLLERLHRLPASARWVSFSLFLTLLGLAAWFGIATLQAKTSLENARNSAEQSKEFLLAGMADDATSSARNAQLNAQQARTATHSLPWNIVAAIPVLGSPLKTSQQITDVVAGLADDVLLPTATMGTTVSPDMLINGTRIDLALLRTEQPRLSELAGAAARLHEAAQAISTPAYISIIGDARSELQKQTAKIAKLLGSANIAAQLAPSMLGAEGPRTYLMGFQTPAEARGTGGLVGAFGILRFDNGTPVVEQLASNNKLLPLQCPGCRNQEVIADIDLGPEFNREYGWTKPYSDIRNSNMSPHFPYAAQIWRSMWEQVSGTLVDGVVALDPIVLSYILGAIGPVTLPDGEEVNADNVVELTMSTAYVRFPRDQRTKSSNERKQYLQDIAGAVATKLTKPLQAPRKFLDALGRAVSEGRIAVWSASPADQVLLEETPLAHVVPDGTAPYAQVVVNNLAGNKMDYYLERELEYAADGCSGDMRNSTVSVRLANTADADQPLPDYVGGADALPPELKLNFRSGTMVSSVRLIATKGAKLLSVTANGKRIAAIPRTDNGHPSFEVQIAIPPGMSGDIAFRLSEPTSDGNPTMQVQPLVDQVNPKVAVPACS